MWYSVSVQLAAYFNDANQNSCRALQTVEHMVITMYNLILAKCAAR